MKSLIRWAGLGVGAAFALYYVARAALRRILVAIDRA